MATPAQLEEKLRAEAESSSKIAVPSQQRAGHEQAEPASSGAYATEAQLAEKAIFDQAAPSGVFATEAQLAEKARRHGAPPALPPRMPPTPAPPPYTSDDAKRSELISEQWRSHDPRSSSTHSLVPSETGRDGRRTMLLVYIHGFMGNETSFQSFPAHVHNLVTIELEETHLVHTKIYPRYKSRKDITFARDDFSTWLEPHEDRSTDVVLLGHSMGGLLSAEVALQKPSSPATGRPFRNRILGTISFDTPFLGMHPGVVVSGLGSLFRPADPPGGAKSPTLPSGTTTPLLDASASSSSYAPSTTPSIVMSDSSSRTQSIVSPLASPSPQDPFFNPPFPNDVRLPERKGWSSLLHFVNKHSDGLTNATKQYFMSHIEFGQSMADYPGLKDRYERIRALEDADDNIPNNGPGYRPPTRRIRFVNYYTASTGRPKKPKVPPGYMLDQDGQLQPIETEMKELNIKETGETSRGESPAIVVEDNTDGGVTPQPEHDASPIRAQMENLGESSGVQNDVQEQERAPMRHIDSMPIEEDEFEEALEAQPTAEDPVEPSIEVEPTPSEPALPPIPPLPTEPDPIDLSLYTDKDARKIAEKEHKRVTKAYQQAIKDRESAIKDRKRLVEKREKKERQEREKILKAEEKQRLKEEKEDEKRKITFNAEPTRERQASVASSSSKDDKPKKDRKFCMLPPEYAGKRDKCWIRVYMEGVDEVGAHCGLFFQGPQYESLVGDVGARIESWVQEDATRRAADGEERL